MLGSCSDSCIHVSIKMGLGRVFFHVLWHDCWHVPLWDTNYSWYSWRFLVHVTSYHHRKIQIHGFQHGICCHDTCLRGDALETLLQRSRRHFTVGSAPACEGSTTLTDVKQSKHLNAGIFDMLLTVICLSLCPSYIYIWGPVKIPCRPTCLKIQGIVLGGGPIVLRGLGTGLWS